MLHLHAIVIYPKDAHFTYIPPVHLLTRIIPNASIAYCQQRWGTILLQELIINGIAVGSYSFELETPCEISINFSKPLAALQYSISGLNESDNNTIGFPFLHLRHGLYYLPPGQSINLHFPAGQYNFWQIHFSLSLLTKFTAGQPAFTHFHQPENSIGTFFSTALVFDKKTRAVLISVIQQVMETPLNAYYVNDRCMYLLTRFIAEYNHFQQHQTWLSKKEQQFLNLEELIREHYTNKQAEMLTTSFLAQKMHLSIYQLKKLIDRMYGLSPAALITKMRMDTAISLLRQQTLTVNEISSRVGYNDLSSFSRAFKKYFGYPPSKLFADKN